MEKTACSPLPEIARVLVRLNHVTRCIVNAAQDHFRATIARRSAVTSRPSLLKVSIRAFESSRSRNILTGKAWSRVLITPEEEKYVDVTGFASGSVVKDPYTG